MEQIFAYRWIEYDNYGDESYYCDFLNASSASEARALAIDLASPLSRFECAHCRNLSPIGLDVLSTDDDEFWQIFETDEEFWADALLEWATEDPEMATHLWALAIENKCDQIQGIAALRALVEQYELEEVAAESAPRNDSVKSGAKERKRKSL